MQGPILLPKELTYYESFKTEGELFQALTKKTEDLIAFFESACEDEVWCREHFKLIRSFLRWGAKNFYTGDFFRPYAQRMARAVQNHHVLLRPFLYFRPAAFFTCYFLIEGKKILVNSLMFGAFSSFFSEIFKLHCYEQLRDEWALPVSLFLFHLVEEHLLKGEVKDLWRQSYQDVFTLMQQARAWDLPSLVKECAEILYRYIDRDNVIETLLKAHRQHFIEWKENCYDFFNQQALGLYFIPGKETDLRVEVLDFKEETLELFDVLAPWLTHVAFSSHLSENSLFGELLTRCPKLIGIDLSGSLRYTNQFVEIPVSLKELDLSACAWLSSQHLQTAHQRFPKLKELHLASNIHLNYLAWGELNQFRQLESLNLARCYQIADEDLKLISQACPHLVELNLEECRRFSDRGLVDLIYICRRLTILNLDRCNTLTDKALNELAVRAYQLTHLSLVRCTEFSDRALLNFVQLRTTLKSLNIADCGFSLKTVENIKNHYPMLQLMT